MSAARNIISASLSHYDMEYKDLSGLMKTINITFKDEKFLQMAMVHRSYLNENHTFPLEHNERLEFLGDAVLELVVTQHLYNNFPNPEGELTNWRAALVNANMLAQVGRVIELENYLYLSKGESKDASSKARNYIIANAVESLIGAIYLDQGYDMAAQFIHEFIVVRLPYIIEHKLYLDPKSRFQEESQARLNATPNYRVMHESGPDHQKHFVVGVYLGDELVAKGEGTSKQEAQSAAAEKGLAEKGW